MFDVGLLQIGGTKTKSRSLLSNLDFPVSRAWKVPGLEAESSRSAMSSGNMDVETYVNRYSGYTVFRRLKFIVDHAASDETRVMARRTLISALKARYWPAPLELAMHGRAHPRSDSNTT